VSSEVIGNNTKPVVGQFAARYGFLEKPVMIRFRVLDPEIERGLRPLCPDMALDAESFGQLRIGFRRVFVMENEINFLSFPRVNGSMAARLSYRCRDNWWKSMAPVECPATWRYGRRHSPHTCFDRFFIIEYIFVYTLRGHGWPGTVVSFC